jgi:sugar phosphate permease
MNAQEQAVVARPIPPPIQAKYSAWKYWASVWNAVHYVIGSGAAIASALTAASIKKNADQHITLLLAVLAAIFAFAQTSVAPQKKAISFVKAYRHLEKAIAKYRYDEAAKESDLGRAESEGIDLLEI